MAFYPYNPSGQRIRGEAGTTAPKRAFLAHFDEAPANANATGIKAAYTLATAFANKTAAATGFLADDEATSLTLLTDTDIAVNDVLKDAAGSELVRVTSIVNAPEYEVERGFAGTTAAGHLTGATWGQYGEYVTAGITQPDVPRCLSTTVNEVDMDQVAYLIGKDAAGAELVEAITSDGSGDLLAVGAEAFDVLSGVVFPVRKDADETMSIGTRNSFGLAHKLDAAVRLVQAMFDKANDAGTLTADASTLSSNVYACAGTPNGTKRLELFYLVG